MALLEKQLYIKTSTLPNAGQGLFTKKAIPKATRIVEYKGRLTTWKEVKHDTTNGYIFTIKPSHVIDAKTHLKALARYANDARGIVRIKGITNNCIYVIDGDKVFIESIREIPAGGEILVSYGKEYWDVMRENLRSTAREEKAAAKTKSKTKRPQSSVRGRQKTAKA